MFVYFGELIERKRAEPGDDMISALIEGEDGDALDETEMKGMCALMLFAGHETTTTTITRAVKVLIDNPDQLRCCATIPRSRASASRRCCATRARSSCCTAGCSRTSRSAAGRSRPASAC